MDETAATRYHSRPLNPKFFKFCARSLYSAKSGWA